MAKPTNKWAVLIGINDYTSSNGKLQPTRRYDINGNEVRFGNLGGCLNDVKNVERFLIDTLKVPAGNIEKLLAPCPEHPADEGLSECSQCLTKRPTYSNIVETLRNLARSVGEDNGTELPKRNKGDLVYIHYSGHGARATTVYSEWKGSSHSRTSTAYHTRPDKEDDTLVPCDIMHGGRFIRDVEISTMLNAMVREELLVTVTLDSCHGGGADRGQEDQNSGNITDDQILVRGIEEIVVSTPDDRPTPEEIRELRDWSKNKYWLYEPKGYVLLAACQKLQKAKEGYAGGVFTTCLFEILRSAPLGISAQTVYEQISHKVHKDRKNRVKKTKSGRKLQNQTPLLLGNMDRCFFNERLQARVYGFTVVGEGTDEYQIRLNGGFIHGVRQGSLYNILTHDSDPSDLEAKQIAKALVAEVFSGYSLATVLTPKEGSLDVTSMEGCPAVLRSLPPQEQFSVRFMTDDELLRDRLETLWRQRHSDNAWIALKNEDTAPAFEISIKRAELTIKSKFGDITSIMGRALSPLSISEGGLPLTIARLARILEHLAQYELFKEGISPEEVTQRSDLINIEVLPSPEPLEEVTDNGIATLYPVPNMVPDKNTGLYQAEESRLFRLKVSNKLDRKVHFAVLVCSAEFSISRIYPPDAPYKTLTRIGSSNDETEDYFDIKAAIADELREASGKGWSPVETYKIFASVHANDLVRLNSLTLEALAKLDISRSQSEQTSVHWMQSEPQDLLEYFQAHDTEGEEEYRNGRLILDCLQEEHEWQMNDIMVRVATPCL
ncbi:hypothetical protein TWF694_008172 [Orbilia ellipsospora]|uniref:Peptidase C14 caspase domain-containing protein n=1 Tax=Orbilia ellipsospora TaxID=2528407 RepID=A0AAV9XFC7_9PEZI